MTSGLPAGRGLDLGCGDGLLTQILLEGVGARNMVGVDPDPAEASQARMLGIYATVHQAGGERIPEGWGPFATREPRVVGSVGRGGASVGSAFACSATWAR